MRPAAIGLGGVVVATAGVVLGLWWTPFVVGVALGLLLRRPAASIPAGAIAGLASWLLPLAGQAFQYGLGPSARSLAEIMGFGQQGLLPVVLTLLVGMLLGLTGAWVAGAAWAVARPTPR